MSDNLVKEHLEEIGVISQDQYIDYVMIDGDKWEIYRLFEDTLLYIKFELTGKIGYAFCAKVTCKRMRSSFEAFYHIKNYSRETREPWQCDQNLKDSLLSHAISFLKPY